MSAGILFGLEMVIGTIALAFLSLVLPKWLPSLRESASGRRSMPVSWRSALVLGLIFIWLSLPYVVFPYFPNAARKYWHFVRGDELRLLHRDSAGWRQVDLPGTPYDIQTSSGGDVWVATMSPNGLSRWSRGQWSHYPLADTPSGGFAVSGGQAWVTGDSGIERFDGKGWVKLPVTVREPMATAAEDNEVWVISRIGTLTHCAGDDCEAHSVTQQIPDEAWDSQRSVTRGGGNSLLVRSHGRLWFMDHAAWYSPDGQTWTEWKGSADAPTFTRGCSGGRVWLGTGDYLVGIGEDLQATDFERDSLEGAPIYGVAAGDGQVMIAGGGHGLFERSVGYWRTVPIDAALRSEDVRNVASTPDGEVWVITSTLLDVRRIVAFGGLILTVLLIWNLRAKRRQKADDSV